MQQLTFTKDIPILILEEVSYSNCLDVYQAGKPLPGNYNLTFEPDTEVAAYCLDEGWTVFQSRGPFGNAKDFFYKKWDEYVEGFGVPGALYRFSF